MPQTPALPPQVYPPTEHQVPISRQASDLFYNPSGEFNDSNESRSTSEAENTVVQDVSQQNVQV